MANSILLRFSTILLFIAFVALPILHPQFHVFGAPVPAVVPVPFPAAAAAIDVERKANPVEGPTYSHIEKRQLLGSLLGGLPSFKNEGANAQKEGVVPSSNTANVGAR